MTEVITEHRIAIALAEGRIRSPQTFCGNIFAVVRLAETGARADSAGEVRYRDAAEWLSPRMCERMIGLPVVSDDLGQLDGKTFASRVRGSVIHSYVDADRLMGVVRIWAVAGPVERSAGRLFARGDTSVVQLDDDDGTRVLIENVPGLIDHLAI